MAELAKEIIRVNIEDEVRQSYLDYAMSVIVGRALPDVRDGLKPVHRRVLFGMQEANNVWNRPYVKCARIVGDVMGKYHPHGDSSIYDTLVRMAQDFSLRYPLDRRPGQLRLDRRRQRGGDALHRVPPRAPRVRAARRSSTRKRSISSPELRREGAASRRCCRRACRTCSSTARPASRSAWRPTFRRTILREVIGAMHRADRRSRARLRRAAAARAGPRFPDRAASSTARPASSRRTRPAAAAFSCARRPRSRPTTTAARRSSSPRLPYQVNKARLIEKIAELRQGKEARRHLAGRPARRVGQGRHARRHRSAARHVGRRAAQQPVPADAAAGHVRHQHGRAGRRPAAHAEPASEILDAFIRHRREVVTRRTIFELRKARARAHVLEGLTVALANIDEMIELIKTSPRCRRPRASACSRRRWEPGLVGALLAAAGADASRPEDMPRDAGLRDDGLSADRNPGAADPRDAPAPPDRSRAGKAHRRIQGSADDDRRPDRDPRRSRDAC